MGSHKPSFADILDHLAGRENPDVASLLAEDPGAADVAARLLRATRDAGRAPRLSRSMARRARRIFRQEMQPSRRTVLELLFDSLVTPAPALRVSSRAAAPRFLRYGTEDISVELQIARIGRSWELRGQVTPADHATVVVLKQNGRAKGIRVDASGVFRFVSLSRGEATLFIGSAWIEDLEI